jgi:hypothetical protein
MAITSCKLIHNLFQWTSRGWNAEYTGFLMTGYKGHNQSNDYVCIDKDAEPIDNDASNKNGALFY